jgi:hypothetical protein
LTKSGRSVYGTCIYPYGRDYYIITINGDLNQHEFLEVFLHEYAHLLANVNYGEGILPHGIEWKNYCREVFHRFISKGLFPSDICIALKELMKRMPATPTANIVRVFAKYGKRKEFAKKFEFCCN